MAAWANAGSVLFGTVGFVLSLNAVIWLVEGILLCWWFQQRLLPSWGIMFLANLASLAAGNSVIFGHSDPLKHLIPGEDPGQKKIAYLTKGRGPLVVMEKELGQTGIMDTTAEVQLKPNAE